MTILEQGIRDMMTQKPAFPPQCVLCRRNSNCKCTWCGEHEARRRFAEDSGTPAVPGEEL